MKLHTRLSLFIFTCQIVFLTIGCSHHPRMVKTIVIERMGNTSEPPNWLNNRRSMWEEKGKLYAVGLAEVEGDSNKDACLEMASLNAKINLIAYASTKGMQQITSSIESLDSEATYSEIKESITQGELNGVENLEKYYELRLRANEAEILSEKLNCYSKVAVSKKIIQKKVKRALSSLNDKREVE